MESGKKAVTVEIAQKIERIYSISLCWLLTGEGEMKTEQPAPPPEPADPARAEEAEEEAAAASKALGSDPMLGKIVLMLAEMTAEERREVFAHVQKTKRLSDLEREVQEMKTGAKERPSA